MAKVPAGSSKIAWKTYNTVGGLVTGTGFAYARFNTEDLRNNIRSIESEEIRAGRLPTGSIPVDAPAGGTLRSQFSAVDFDEWIALAMLSAWSSNVYNSTANIAISGVSGTAFTLHDNDTSGAFANAVVGQFLFGDGYTTNAGVIVARVTSKTSNNEVICAGFRSLGVNSTAAVVNEAGSGTNENRWQGTYVRIGETQHYVAVEKQFPNKTANMYRLWKDMIVGSMGFDIAPQAIAQVAFAIQGKASASQITTSNAGTPSAAGTNEIMNAISNVRHVMEGDFAVPTAMKLLRLQMNLNNNPESLPAIAVFGADEAVAGTVSLTGAISAYLEDLSIVTKVEARTPSKLAWVMSDAAGYFYVFSIAALDYTSDDTVIAKRTGAINLDANWGGKIDANNVALQIDKVVTPIT